MLFHSQIAPGSGIDIDQIVCYLNEKLDIDKYLLSWIKVINAHPVCRISIYVDEQNEYLHNVNESVNLVFEEESWIEHSAAKRKEKLLDFLEKDRRRGFNLNNPPLMRNTLIKLSNTEYFSIWTFHHILMDGRSHAIILKDVFSCYDELCKGHDYKIKQTTDYKNFIEWLDKQNYSKSEKFWRNFLKGFNSPTKLGLKTPAKLNNCQKQLSSNVREILVDKSTTDRLKEFVNNHKITLNTLVQGAWAILLSRYSGNEDVLFGAVRAGRYSTIEGADSVVGLFMNTLPMRIHVKPEQVVTKWLAELRQLQNSLRDYEHTPLIDILGWSGVPRNIHLFTSVLIYDNFELTSYLQSLGESWENREFELYEKTGFPLTMYVYADKNIRIKLAFENELFHNADIERLLSHFKTILIGLAEFKDKKLSEISILTEDEKLKLFLQWNNTKGEFPHDKCVHHLFEEQVAKTPDSTAVVCKGESITFDALNKQSNQLATRLQKLGVISETLVGIYINRSVEMMIAILAVLKAGGAYIPLDPGFPSERISYMLKDSKCRIIISEKSKRRDLGSVSAQIILIDDELKHISKESSSNTQSEVTPENLCYVIYTSGSTGKPKGVMVQHYNVVNFFSGVNQHLNPGSPGSWLAVTSLSFDISVLELLWPLTHGFNVIINAEEDWKTSNTKSASSGDKKKIDFSLFYFSSYEGENPKDRYHLLLEGAKFADQNGFFAVWTPERHFHDFGGLYPNPSVTGAAISTITKNVKILCGSCVSPLHNPIRIAEEWSVVDNLSNGRVGISFASGWQPNDFILMPENYERRKEIMFEQIETVRKLWNGETLKFKSPGNKNVDIKTLPRPIQNELPIWLTAAANPETFREAGEKGYNLLTHLLGQSVEEVEEKISIYREARRACKNNPGEGHVTLMLHTFIGENLDEVRSIVREPMKNYLKSAVDLVKLASWYFPTFDKLNEDFHDAVSGLNEDDYEAILNHSFERYFETSSLLGTPESTLKMVEKLKSIGVDEIACLIDFGVESEKVLSHLQYLNALKTIANLGVREAKLEDKHDYSISKLAMEHKPTHMQCTPSMARMLLMDHKTKSIFKNLEYLLIGGEAFPVMLAQELRKVSSAEIFNMYGPTETTIWSTIYKLNKEEESISIGRPLLNTEVYILDKYQQPVPIGFQGELCIGGEGVVRGYFDKPELTSEKFIPYRFDKNSKGKRIYRTGDLVSYRENGVIDFLGRLDNQVKIRGYRIELGEIETILEKHENIKEAVVVARVDETSDKKLVAYLISKRAKSLSTNDLRAYLNNFLPEYMIPSIFIFLDKFPLTPNGKIDRNALPAPDVERPELNKEFIPPRTEIENIIAKHWSQVLGVKQIGIYDNFFELGGHSLSAVQVTVKLQQAFNLNFSLQTFFQSSNLSELAIKIEEKLLEQVEDNHLEKFLNEIEKNQNEY